MKTPIQELIDFMDDIAVKNDVDEIRKNAITQLHSYIRKEAVSLLEKEMQIIIDAYFEIPYDTENHGWCDSHSEIDCSVCPRLAAKQYYNQTFKK